ncbi:MAG: hypothetical protein ACPGTO_02985 [Polaribacter sp.]
MKKTVSIICLFLFSTSLIHGQEVKKENDKLYVKVKDDAKPDIYVDGKKFDFPMELIDQSKIKAVFVIKNEEAIKKYNAPNGVILITTKKNVDLDVSKIKSDNIDLGKNKPTIIIDGKVTSYKILKGLTPDKIEKMEVIKGEKAIKKYNSPNGVILITTKK